MHLPNHFLFGATLATVPDINQDWKGAGCLIFPALSLQKEFEKELIILLENW